MVKTDEALVDFTGDEFQRIDFVRTLSSIVVPNHKRPLVVALYGEWGEGKTSVLNAVQANLRNKDGSKYYFFHPWIYENQSQMLQQLLVTIGRAYNVKIRRKLEEYGDAPILGATGVGAVAGAIYGGTPGAGVGAKVTAPVARWVRTKIGRSKTLDEIYKGIEGMMEVTSTRLVLALDDLDRLDVNELMLILKMVKHTAGFSNITYILSCSDHAIAPLIAQSFGQGSEEVGFQYLEKIVQIGIRLPKARPDQLFGLLERGIGEIARVDFSELVPGRFGSQVSRFAMLSQDLREASRLLLANPRQIKRYLSNLQYKQSIIGNEVNIEDLARLTILEVAASRIYMLIRDRPYLFMDHRDVRIQIDSPQSPDEREKELKSELEELFAGKADRVRKLCTSLIVALFPHLQSELQSALPAEGLTTRDRDLQLRIASARCFDRYFSLSVSADDLSETTLQLAFDEIMRGQYQSGASKAALAYQTNSEIFLAGLKVKIGGNQFFIDALIRFCQWLIADLETDFTPYGYRTDLAQVCFLIRDSLHSLSSPDKACKRVSQLLREEARYKVAYSMLNFVKQPISEGEHLLHNDCVEDMYLYLKDRMLSTLDDEFCAVGLQAHSLNCLLAWRNQDREDADAYIRRFIESSALNLAKFLQYFAGTHYVNLEGLGSMGDFTDESLNFMVSQKFHVDYFADQARLSAVNFSNKSGLRLDTVFGQSNTVENIILQFLHYYDLGLVPSGQA